MRHLILSALLALFTVALPAMAADVSVSWTQPVTNTDGSAIPASGAGAIASNRVEWGSCSGAAFGVKAGEKTVTPAATSTTVTGLAPGTHCFRAYATNTYGAESAASNVASKVISPPTPNPPVITVATVVYELTNKGGIGKYVGSVPLGTSCVGDVRKTWADGTTWYEVPRSSVTLTKPTRAKVLVAKCSAA